MAEIRYAVDGVRPVVHTRGMEIHRSRQFKRWIDGLVTEAKSGDQRALRVARHVYDELTYLQGLDAEPDEDTATLKRVRQSGKYPVWRLSHPFDRQMAVRIIVWFNDESGSVVVALFAADKAPMGDVLYDSVGSRADQAIDQWKREKEGTR